MLGITVDKKFKINSAAKCVCLLSDKGHVAVGTFNGTITMWNVEVWKNIYIILFFYSCTIFYLFISLYFLYAYYLLLIFYLFIVFV